MATSYIAPHFASSAVITIDVQCDTLDGQPLEIPGTSAALPNIRRVLDIYRRQRKPIVHIVRIYTRDGQNVDLCRREAVEQGAQMLLQGSAGCELAPDLFAPNTVALDHERLLAGNVQAINDHEVIIYKPRWGAFYQTPLVSRLNRYGIDTLVFLGCNFPNCPRTSIYEASERDFRIVLVNDAMSGVYSRGIDELRHIGVTVVSAKAVEQAMSVSAA